MYSNKTKTLLKKYFKNKSWIEKAENNDPTLAIAFSNFIAKKHYDEIHIGKYFKISNLTELLKLQNKQTEILKLERFITLEALNIISKQGKDNNKELFDMIQSAYLKSAYKFTETSYQENYSDEIEL